MKLFRQFFLTLSRRFLSRWVVLAIDMALAICAFILAYLLRFNFELSPLIVNNLLNQLWVYALAFLIAFLVVRPFRGIVRYASLYDAMKVVFAVSLAIFFLLFCSRAYHYAGRDMVYVFPLSILLISYLASMFFMLMLRVAVKVFYQWIIRNSDKFQNVLIYGAGEMGMATRRTLESKADNKLKVVGFIDDDPQKIGKSLEGINVYSREVLNPRFVIQKQVEILIMAIQKMDPGLKVDVIDHCMDLGLELRRVPRFEDWINGRLSYQQIRKVRIEDLLSRDPIRLENENLSHALNEKVVLVTGAAGSIGSELSRQLLYLRPERLLMLDNAETPLAELEIRLRPIAERYQVQADFLLADISQRNSMDRIFKCYQPDYVYHAAAYKHVPVLEKNPLEAVRINILGTRILARKAIRYKAERFVMVSSDKAVNPGSIMGLTKRIAEMCIQEFNSYHNHNTRFITTRFGNVLGSNGSVIPIFEKQIADGGPVTVTHPDVVRYFMTIPEACQLVLEASNMGMGGEIFVFDMGEQLRILDVAKKMIRLSGLEPDKDIPIVFTGLRPGEKLYEELFGNNETNLPTHHPKIMIATVNHKVPGDFFSIIDTLQAITEKEEPTVLMSIMQNLVPEYKRPSVVAGGQSSVVG